MTAPKPPRDFDVTVRGGCVEAPWTAFLPCEPGTYYYRLVRERREPIAWVIKSAAGDYLTQLDERGAVWGRKLVLALRYGHEEGAMRAIERIDDDLRARPVALVRRGAS